MDDCRVFGQMPDYDDTRDVDTRIIGLLSWYDEQPAWLAELVGSLARAGVEHLVAVDGAYAAFPNGTGGSPSEQAQTVLAAASGCGIGVTIHQPQTSWKGGEIEKRTFLFAAAHLVARPELDWLWVVDGDEIVTHADGLKTALATTPCDVAQVTLWEGVTSGEHEAGSQALRMLFRAQRTGIRVTGHHACYVTGDGQILWDSWQPTSEAPAEQLPHVKVRHRPGDRPPARNRKRNDYYNLVKSQKLERTS